MPAGDKPVQDKGRERHADVVPDHEGAFRPCEMVREDAQEIAVKPVEVGDADEPSAEDAEAEAESSEQRAPDDQHRKDDPIGDLKPSLEGVFFAEAHFLPLW